MPEVMKGIALAVLWIFLVLCAWGLLLLVVRVILYLFEGKTLDEAWSKARGKPWWRPKRGVRR